MANYAEFLKSEGATDEDVKLLDTPLARKAFDKQQALVAAADAKRESVVKANEVWAQQVEADNQRYLKERDSAKIEAAAAAARIAKMGELGLIEVAERMEPGSTKPPAATDPAAFDASKYVTNDVLLSVAEREGDAIAIAQDISFEHQQLFGGDAAKRLNFRELRREAIARKIPVESLWMEKYGVQAARDSRSAADRAAHEKKIADEAITRYKSEHPESNPMLQSPRISSTPFVTPPSASTERQPWLKSDGEKEHARLNKVLQSLQSQGLA